MNLDLKNSLTIAAGLAPAAVTADGNGSGIDLKNYIGCVLAILHVGAATAGSSPTMDVKIQDSADNSTFADVTGYTFTQVTTSDSLQTLNVDTRLVRRYIRFVKDIGGTSSPSFPMSAAVIGQVQTV